MDYFFWWTDTRGVNDLRANTVITGAMVKVVVVGGGHLRHTIHIHITVMITLGQSQYPPHPTPVLRLAFPPPLDAPTLCVTHTHTQYSMNSHTDYKHTYKHINTHTIRHKQSHKLQTYTYKYIKTHTNTPYTYVHTRILWWWWCNNPTTKTLSLTHHSNIYGTAHINCPAWDKYGNSFPHLNHQRFKKPEEGGKEGERAYQQSISVAVLSLGDLHSDRCFWQLFWSWQDSAGHQDTHTRTWSPCVSWFTVHYHVIVEWAQVSLLHALRVNHCFFSPLVSTFSHLPVPRYKHWTLLHWRQDLSDCQQADGVCRCVCVNMSGFFGFVCCFLGGLLVHFLFVLFCYLFEFDLF